jgi:hypothetical protein
MDIYWETIHFDKEKCQGVVINKGDGKLTIMGELKCGAKLNTQILYWASNPTNTRCSFSGSGLPYASPEQAYDNSVNVGAVTSVDGKFKFTINFPNSYYLSVGTIYVPPHVHLKIMDGAVKSDYYSIKLGKGNKYRRLSHPNARTGPNFYDNLDSLPFRSQEQILRDSAICNTDPNTRGHFGLKPAL